MSDRIHDYAFNLDGEIVFDRLIVFNTSGASCDLFVGTHPKVRKVALKRPRGDCYDETTIASIEVEASVWKALKHPRVLEFLGLYEIADEIYFVSPLAENGSLHGFIAARPDVNRTRLVLEIAEGLAYLHQCGIIHGDLKGNNILISGSESVLLCDFGLAKHVTSRTSTSRRGFGSIQWQSPEILRTASRRTFQSDLYAFGITIYEVLSGEKPYSQHVSIGSMVTAVLLHAERPPKEPMYAPDGTSYGELWDEASKCWDEDPARRPTISAVLSRLDRQRAEAFVTTQQIGLETSLNLATSSSANDFQDFASPGENTKQTLIWARSLRERFARLVNSKLLISRLSPEILSEIIFYDSATADPRHFRTYNRALRNFFQSRTDHEGLRIASNILRMFRTANLRTVSREWLKVIDNSKEFNSLVWVGSYLTNVGSIQRCNPQGDVECILSVDQPDRVSFALEPISHRITRLVIITNSQRAIEPLGFCNLPKVAQQYLYFPEPNTQYERPDPFFIKRYKPPFRLFSVSMRRLILENVSPASFADMVFPVLRTLELRHTTVTKTFIGDLFAVLETSPDLTELVLESLNFEVPEDVDSLTPSHLLHRGLQKIRVQSVPLRIQSSLGLYLYAENLRNWNADYIQPNQLINMEHGLAQTMRSFVQAHRTSPNKWYLGINRYALFLLWCTEGTKGDRARERVRYVGELWDYNRMTIRCMEDRNILPVLDTLVDWGIQLEGVTLEWATDPDSTFDDGPRWWLEVLGRIRSVSRLSAAVNVAPIIIKNLSRANRQGHYLCPSLTHLEIIYPDLTEGPETLWQLIGSRQVAATRSDGPKKLERVTIPRDWASLGAMDLSLKDVEMYTSWD